MIHYTSSKIITSHYLQFYNKRKKNIEKKTHKKKTNKKLSSNYIKLKVVCKYARKNKSSEKENTSKSFCLTSLSLNTISLSKVKKMYQKVILHLSTGRTIPERKFFICPPNQKSIHTFYQIFFSNLCTFNSYCQKIL